jgi:hypothetical protein
MMAIQLGLGQVLIYIALPTFQDDLDNKTRYPIPFCISFGHFARHRSLIGSVIDHYGYLLETTEIFFMKKYFKRY